MVAVSGVDPSGHKSANIISALLLEMIAADHIMKRRSASCK
jgi:hypothetical protein